MVASGYSSVTLNSERNFINIIHQVLTYLFALLILVGSRPSIAFEHYTLKYAYVRCTSMWKILCWNTGMPCMRACVCHVQTTTPWFRLQCSPLQSAVTAFPCGLARSISIKPRL